MASRAAALILVTIGLALGFASVTAGRAHPGWWFAGESDLASALELLAGLALLAAATAAWGRRPTSRFGPLLFLAGVAWFLPEWSNPDSGGSLAFSAGVALVAGCPPLAAHAALGYPGGRLRSPAERVAVGLLYLASLGMLGVLPAFAFDPSSSGCAECPENLLLVSTHADLAETLQEWGLWLGAASAMLVVLS